MRIAYLSNAPLPSDEANAVQVMKMCAAFAGQGHTVSLFARTGPMASTDVHRYYGVGQTFQVVRFHRPAIAWAGKALFAARVARAVGRRPQPDLLYARDPLSLCAAASLGSPLVFEMHGLPSGSVSRLAHWWLFTRPNFRRLVVISEALRRDVMRAMPWLDAETIVAAHDAAQLPAGAGDAGYRAQWTRRTGKLRVGYVGQLYPGKGMEIIAPLAQRLPDVEFHVVGGAAEDVAAWRGRINGTANLFLHGHVPPQATESFRQAMDVLLVPTQPEVARAGGSAKRAAWISPLKLFEYMASRKPVVVSDLPVLREVVQHEVNALLVPPSDVGAWAAAIQQLAGDAALRARLAEQAYQTVAARHTWEQRARRVLEGLEA